LLDNEDLRLEIAAAAQRIATWNDAERTTRAFDEIYRRVVARRATRGVAA
jgi:hypothetical protein